MFFFHFLSLSQQVTATMCFVEHITKSFLLWVFDGENEKNFSFNHVLHPAAAIIEIQ
jgi:hypothetical protein